MGGAVRAGASASNGGVDGNDGNDGNDGVDGVDGIDGIDLEELRESARAFLARWCDTQRVRSRLEEADDVDTELWRRMGELGWPAIAVPEAYDGAGAGFRELAVIVHELGRALAPATFVASAVLGVAALTAEAVPEVLKAEWLPRMASGDVVVVALARPGSSPSVACRAAGLGGDGEAAEDGGVVLTGTIGVVAEAAASVAIVVEAIDDAGEHVVALIETADPTVTVRPVRMADLTRRFATVELAGTTVAASRVLARRADAAAIVGRVFDWGAAALAADALGAGERVLEGIVDYARQRVQFGRVIGSFQAYKHRCADLLIALESARVTVDDAAVHLATDDPAAAASVSMAKSYTGDAMVTVAGEGVQLHGGIGYTWEHHSHLFLKRALLDQVLYGDSRWHRRRLAALRIPTA